jgi:deazaflavin-dependent oxidoreductase (nitroreductase family)
MAGDPASSEQPDLRERLARRFFRLVNPLACRMIPKGVPTGAPNIVLIVRGRRSGIERPTPVAMLEVDGDSYVQATYGAEGWARNLRAAGEASIVHSGGRRSSVHAIEVPPDKAAVILRGVLGAVPPAAFHAQLARRQRTAARCPSTPIPGTHRRHPRGLPRRSSTPPAVRTPPRVRNAMKRLADDCLANAVSAQESENPARIGSISLTLFLAVDQ